MAEGRAVAADINAADQACTTKTKKPSVVY